MRFSSKECSYLLINGRGTNSLWWCHPQKDGPEFSKKAGGESHVKQASKPHASMASLWAPPPGSLPVWVSILVYFIDKQSFGSVNSVNQFPPQLSFQSGCFIAAIDTPTKTLRREKRERKRKMPKAMLAGGDKYFRRLHINTNRNQDLA